MSTLTQTSTQGPTAILRTLFSEHRFPEGAALLNSGNLPAALKPEALENWQIAQFANNRVTSVQLLSKLILSIDPEKIEFHFGSGAIFWALSVIDLRPSIMPETCAWLEKKGISLLDLAAAGRALQMFDCSRLSTALLLRTYEIACKLRQGQHGVDSLAELLAANLEPPVEMGPAKLKRYSLQSLVLERRIGRENVWAGYLSDWNDKCFQSGSGFKRYDNLYSDQTLGLLLLFNGQPQAITSFVPLDSHTLYVVQLQGQKASVVNERGEPMNDQQDNPLYVGSRGLVPLRLPSFLLKVSMAFAKAHNFSRLVLIGAENTGYIRDEDDTRQRLQRIYDENAEEHGFVQGEDGNWVGIP